MGALVNPTAFVQFEDVGGNTFISWHQEQGEVQESVVAEHVKYVPFYLNPVSSLPSVVGDTVIRWFVTDVLFILKCDIYP